MSYALDSLMGSECTIVCISINCPFLQCAKRHTYSVMPLAGGLGVLYPTRNLGFQLLNPIPTGGQFMPTALLHAQPDLKTLRHLCNSTHTQARTLTKMLKTVNKCSI